MKIGLFFGTFNPVHLGHVEIATKILNENFFDQLWVILTPRSPHKNSNLVKKEDRLQMLKLAFKDYEKVLVSDVEFRLQEPNYTINTLKYLNNKFPKYTFSIIMGSDNFLKIKNWKNSSDIKSKYNIYVYPREGFPFKDIMNNKLTVFLDFPDLKVSSTHIRSNIISNPKDIEKYLSPKVFRYIKHNSLY